MLLKNIADCAVSRATLSKVTRQRSKTRHFVPAIQSYTTNCISSDINSRKKTNKHVLFHDILNQTSSRSLTVIITCFNMFFLSY